MSAEVHIKCDVCAKTICRGALEALAIAADARPGDSNFKLHTIQISFTEGKR